MNYHATYLAFSTILFLYTLFVPFLMKVHQFTNRGISRSLNLHKLFVLEPTGDKTGHKFKRVGRSSKTQLCHNMMKEKEMGSMFQYQMAKCIKLIISIINKEKLSFVLKKTLHLQKEAKVCWLQL